MVAKLIDRVKQLDAWPLEIGHDAIIDCQDRAMRSMVN
jgi:hypothetical protein